jgi:hypothetical protein
MSKPEQQPPVAQKGQRPRHVPRRTCVACRRTDAKRGLIRLVRTAEGGVAIDPGGKRQGRGAYLCAVRTCWQTAFKRKQLERALRLEKLRPDDRATLEQYIEHLEDTMADE